MGRDLILMLLLICAIGGYVAWENHRVSSAEDRAERATVTASRLQAELSQAKASERIVTRFVDRVQVIHERGATITREIPVYVTEKSDRACAVPAGFVSVHNAAAANVPLSEPAGDPDAPAAGVTLSAVAETVAGNYGTCNATAAQLSALEDWLLEAQHHAQPEPAR